MLRPCAKRFQGKADSLAVCRWIAVKVRSIETVPVIAPLAREYRGSHYRMTHRATLVVRLHTDEGLVGEAYVADEDKTLLDIERILVEEIGPRVVGQDVFATERLWELGYQSTFDILRDRRLGLVALAGLDTAVWDAVGKALGVPLWKLWGGYRDTIPMVVIGGYYGQPAKALVEEVEGYLALGLAGMKLKVGGHVTGRGRRTGRSRPSDRRR